MDVVEEDLDKMAIIRWESGSPGSCKYMMAAKTLKNQRVLNARRRRRRKRRYNILEIAFIYIYIENTPF